MYGFEMLSRVVKLRRNCEKAAIPPWRSFWKCSTCSFTVASLPLFGLLKVMMIDSFQIRWGQTNPSLSRFLVKATVTIGPHRQISIEGSCSVWLHLLLWMATDTWACCGLCSPFHVTLHLFIDHVKTGRLSSFSSFRELTYDRFCVTWRASEPGCAPVYIQQSIASPHPWARLV